ncbi:MAG: hypothetical protein RR769_05535 [Anaerovoracaceae bacterium]
MKAAFSKKIRMDMVQLINGFETFGKALGGGKKTRMGLAALPLVGWLTSEIHHMREKNKQKEKDCLYQEIIRKHQAEIDILKTDNEREKYLEELRIEVCK